jgi:tRNA threonylcarbamoyladenosine biosynthesis protein TsaB
MELLVATAQLAPGRYMAALDAGRGEYHISNVAVFDGCMIEIAQDTLISGAQLRVQAHELHTTLVGPDLDVSVFPRAAAALSLLQRLILAGPVPLDTWEPRYGRLAEAQVKWEAVHKRSLVL